MSTDSKETQNKQCNIPVVGRSAITYEQFQEALKIVNEYKTQLEEHYKIAKKEIEGISKFANVTKETLIFDTDISIRLLNILRCNGDKLNIEWLDRNSNIKELEGLSMSKFLQCRIAGKKGLQELKELCFYAGVKLLPQHYAQRTRIRLVTVAKHKNNK